MPARNITTEMWSDPTVAELSPSALLTWIRLLTGPETTCAGTTRVLTRTLAVETNQSRGDVDDALGELLEAGLVERHGELLWIPGWIDHQVSGRGMLIAARREAARRDMPADLSARIRATLDNRFGPAPAPAPDTHPRRSGSRKAAGSLPSGSQEADARVRAATEDYSGPPSLREEGGLSAAAPAPAPGAQTPPREIDEDAAERQAAGAVALAEVAGEVTDPDIAAHLTAQVERLAGSTALPDPGPPPDPEPVHTGTLDDEQVVSAAGLRSWEERSLLAWQSGDTGALRELQRSGSPMARAAAARLLREGQP